jgi:hypothetical protein
LVSILKKLGHIPQQIYLVSPSYLRLWAIATSGQLLGFDVTDDQKLLQTEIDRLDKIEVEYRPIKDDLERQLRESEERLREHQQILLEAEKALIKLDPSGKLT